MSTTQKNAQTRSNLKQLPPTKPTPGDVDAEWTHDLHGLNNPSASRATQPYRGPKKPHVTRTERLYSALNGSASSPALNTQFNVIGAANASKAISIKGLAGPYIVMAKNFALGTTADDIESAMTPIGGVCLSCRIITESPSVIAEIIFESREGADNVVSTFNNQNVSSSPFGLSKLPHEKVKLMSFLGRWQPPPCLPQSRSRSQTPNSQTHSHHTSWPPCR